MFGNLYDVIIIASVVKKWQYSSLKTKVLEIVTSLLNRDNLENEVLSFNLYPHQVKTLVSRSLFNKCFFFKLN